MYNVYNVQCTLYTIQIHCSVYTMYSVQTYYNNHHTLNTDHYAVHSVHGSSYNIYIHCTSYNARLPHFKGFVLRTTGKHDIVAVGN